MTVTLFFSYVLLVIGVLIAATTGICSLIGLSAIGSDPEGALLVLTIGGVPCLVGVLLAVRGWHLVREHRDV